jgi:hypothetical protein
MFSSGIVSLRNGTPDLSRIRLVSELCFTIEAEQQTFTVRYSHREAKCLGGPLLPSGKRFRAMLGLWDNFSVAKGMDTQAWTIKPRPPLLSAAEELLLALEIDGGFFRYDYRYSFSSNPKQRNTGGMGVAVNGRWGTIDARRPGQVFIKFTDSNPEEGGDALLDLRKSAPVETPLGVIKIHRRKNQLDWQPKLERLIKFLRSISEETVRIRHHYPD